jgi:hypothetical protein
MADHIQIESNDQKKDRFISRISFWASIVLSIAITGWYFMANPPPEGAEKRMRLFIAKNAQDVTEFLRMTRDEQKAFAEKRKHLFYTNYLKASENTKLDIRGLVHNSTDYKPTQYWFNLVFMWCIFFFAFWFIGLMSEAAIQINRTSSIERKAQRETRKKMKNDKQDAGD